MCSGSLVLNPRPLLLHNPGAPEKQNQGFCRFNQPKMPCRFCVKLLWHVLQVQPLVVTCLCFQVASKCHTFQKAFPKFTLTESQACATSIPTIMCSVHRYLPNEPMSERQSIDPSWTTRAALIKNYQELKFVSQRPKSISWKLQFSWNDRKVSQNCLNFNNQANDHTNKCTASHFNMSGTHHIACCLDSCRTLWTTWKGCWTLTALHG